MCCNILGVGVNCSGLFVEYFCIFEDNVVFILDDILDEIVVIFDLFGNVVYIVFSFDFVGEDVLVMGVGLIGIMGVLVV